MKHFYSVHTSTTAGRDLFNGPALLSHDVTLDKEGEGPQILIYHTHSQEAFKDSGPQGRTIVEVGDYLAELLTQKGYRVYHDTSVYDLQSGVLDRSKAYNYALEGVNRILQQNPSIQVVLDLHRDGVSENLHMVSDINGKPTAQIMFLTASAVRRRKNCLSFQSLSGRKPCIQPENAAGSTGVFSRICQKDLFKGTAL